MFLSYKQEWDNEHSSKAFAVLVNVEVSFQVYGSIYCNINLAKKREISFDVPNVFSFRLYLSVKMSP